MVGSTTDWTAPFSFNLAGNLLQGNNVLAIAGHDTGGVAATQAQLLMGTTVLLGSSSTSWKYSLTNPIGWVNVNFDDSSWSTPVAKSQTAGPWYNNNKIPINDGSASWIWSTEPENHNDVYFRIGFVFKP
jgi:hypothetical protein